MANNVKKVIGIVAVIVLAVPIIWLIFVSARLWSNSYDDLTAPEAIPKIGKFDQYSIPGDKAVNVEAYISKLVGNVQLTSRLTDRSGKKPPPRPAQIGDRVMGATLETSGGGFVEIVVPYSGKVFLDENTSATFPVAVTLKGMSDPYYSLNISFGSGRAWVNLDRSQPSLGGKGVEVSTGDPGLGTLVIATKRSSFGLEKRLGELTVVVGSGNLRAYFTKRRPPSLLVDGPLAFVPAESGVVLPIYDKLFNDIVSAGNEVRIDENVPGSASVTSVSLENLKDPFLQTASAEILWEDVNQEQP